MSEVEPTPYGVSPAVAAELPERKRLGCCGGFAIAALILALLSIYPILRFNQKLDRTGCALRLRNLQLGAMQYADDTKYFPYADGDFEAALDLLEKAGRLPHGRPECKVRGLGAFDGFKAPFNRNVSSWIMIAWEREPHPNEGRAVLMADSTVDFVDEEGFKERLAVHDRWAKRLIEKHKLRLAEERLKEEAAKTR